MEPVLYNNSNINNMNSENANINNMVNASGINVSDNDTRVFSPKRVKFSDYGYEMAGRNAGDSKALETHFNEIIQGYIVDENYNENDFEKKKKAVRDRLSAIKENVIELKGKSANILSVSIPSVERQIKACADAKKEITLDKIREIESSEYSFAKQLIYVSLSVILFVGIILYYASLIYTAFFSNLLQKLTAGTDPSLVLNGFLDLSFIEHMDHNFVIAFILSFVMVGIASAFKIAGKGVFEFKLMGKSFKLPYLFLMAALLEILFACIIGGRYHEVKELMGKEDQVAYYLEPVFYAVIIFGILMYVSWAFLIEASFEEKFKKSGTQIYKAKLKFNEEEMDSLNKSLDNLKSELNACDTDINKLNLQCEALEKELDAKFYSVTDLKRWLHAFYTGWLRYLNNGDLLSAKLKCDEVYNGVIGSLN
jgi:hypothetical protein